MLPMKSIACSPLMRRLPGILVSVAYTSAKLCAPQHPVD
jgi:hypothetical protein